MSSRVVVTCEFALEFLQRKKKLVTCECAHVTREWSTLPRLLPFLDERAAGRDPAGPELVNLCRSSRKTAVAVGSGVGVESSRVSIFFELSSKLIYLYLL